MTRLGELRMHGITPLPGNLDESKSLRRLAGLATRVLHLAPPDNNDPSERKDLRTRSLLQVLRLRSLPQSVVYASTSGVYGDCRGEWVKETRSTNPQTARAWRRVDAETALRVFGRSSSTPVHVLRIPGIYAPDREGGTPRGRLLKGTPVLVPTEDVYTNHIHADDLARVCLAAMWRGRTQRVTHASDDSRLKMGDYFDLAADLYGLPRPPRLERSAVALQVPVKQLSFMAESRQLENQRLKRELRLVLRYPTVAEGLRS
jgi:nucleoside-diphosphate-sugar epimerase